MSTYVKDVGCVMNCAMSDSAESSSPMFADLLFVSACYLYVYPELRYIIRRRFLKRSLRFVSFFTSIGLTSFLMLVITAAQARSTFCRYLKPIMVGTSPEKLRMVGLLLVGFFVIFNLFLARSVKDSACGMWATFRNLRRRNPKQDAILSSFRGMGGSRKRAIIPRPQRHWKKMTRSGTIYGR